MLLSALYLCIHTPVRVCQLWNDAEDEEMLAKVCMRVKQLIQLTTQQENCLTVLQKVRPTPSQNTSLLLPCMAMVSQWYLCHSCLLFVVVLFSYVFCFSL